jgi:K+-transporting ATPase KdpF subunit
VKSKEAPDDGGSWILSRSCELLPDQRRAGAALCTVDGGQDMTGIELIGLMISLGLLTYLIVALLRPEWFS